MIRSIILSLLIPLSHALRCDSSFSDRTTWANNAIASLTNSGAFSSVISGKVMFAPIGTISNPAGTYGTIMFDNPNEQYPEPSNQFCDCISSGNTTISPFCNQLEDALSTSSETACTSTFVLAPSDAVVMIGCTPPTSQYFAFQTNLYSKFKNTQSTEEDGIFFPEVAPYDAINNLVINTTSTSEDPFNCAYVSISSADKNTINTVKEALMDAGVPEKAVNVDSLFSEDVRFWDGFSDWRDQLPDSLEIIFRINGVLSEDMKKYILESEKLATQQAFILRATTSSSSFSSSTIDPATALWRPRVVAPEESNNTRQYGDLLDSLATSVNDTASQQGYVLSYYGDVKTSMDFGYKQESDDSNGSDTDDVDQCCLSFPHNSEYWSSTVHYSTSDCLYETYGYLSDIKGGWNDSQATLIGSTRYMSTEATGPTPQNISAYSNYVCSSNNASGYDALMVQTTCLDSTCGSCGLVAPVSSFSDLSGCVHNNGYNEEYTCVNGTPMILFYSDSNCSGVSTSSYDLSSCNPYETDPVDEQMWTGGIFRNTSIVVMLGAMSNKLNSSQFHDIYLPVTATYFSPDQQLDFVEEELSGSGISFMPKEGHIDQYSNLFVAQWGRSCLKSINNNNNNSGYIGEDDIDDSNVPCYEITSDMLLDNAPFYLIVRHYLDPFTKTGPHKDALPRHRVMVFDKKEVNA